MQFAYPHILWLLLVLPPALVAFYWWAIRTRQRLATQFIQARLLPGLLHGYSPARQKLRMASIVVAMVFLIVALARPQWGFDWEEVKQRGLDIVMAIDTSKSMLAEDIAPNRLTRAKLAALDLMQQAKFDRLGLVAFAGRGFLQCPLTIDDAAFRQSVESLDVNTIPQGGTALAEAIRISMTAFKESDNYKVLVLFTDGEDNDQGALEAAQAAAKDGLRIFTVGVGTAEGEILRVTDNQGHSDYIRDEQGNVVKSHLNEALLQEIAGATEGGFYLPLRGAKTVDTLYERGLAPLPKTDEGVRRVKHYHEQYRWPLAVAILLLMAEMLLPERSRRRRHAGAVEARPKAPLRAAAAVVMLLATASWAAGSPARALREYQSGNFDAALKDYQQALQRKTDDPRLNFNAGAAAYRDHQYNEAAKHFGEALTAQDLQLQQQAYYNMGNTLYRLGEDVPDTKKKQETWEDSLKRYQAAMKLNPGDDDARYNYEFVKKKLEELKQQQQQQQQGQDKQDNKDKNQDQQKDQQNQQQQSQDQQDKNSQQKQDQQQQNQQNKQDQQQDKNKSDQQKNQQNQQDKPNQKKDQQQPPGEKKQGDKGDEQKEPQPAEGRADQRPMTPQEARQLLDAQKGDEQFLQLRPQGKPEDQDRHVKDW